MATVGPAPTSAVTVLVASPPAPAGGIARPGVPPAPARAEASMTLVAEPSPPAVAVAAPVLPRLVDDDWAVESPELPLTAVGDAVRVAEPPSPATESPVATESPPMAIGSAVPPAASTVLEAAPPPPV